LSLCDWICSIEDLVAKAAAHFTSEGIARSSTFRQ
jgi:hypothetical protein